MTKFMPVGAANLLGRLLKIAFAKILRRSLRTCAVAAAAIAVMSGPAHAQVSTTAETTTEPLQEIIVTGSRIAAPNQVSTSPIQVVSSQYIKETGKTDITDIISLLPQNLHQ